jgi:hypothetical protein
MSVAPTQMQNFPVPRNSVRQWTEWFKGFDGDVSVLRGEYKGALGAIEDWIKSPEGMQKESTKDWDEFFAQHGESSYQPTLV